jgi:DNA-binding transcriptional LysR family regulator
LDELMNHIEQSPMLAFSELRGVIAVAEHRNFRRAAAELGISASALSHSIASLEQRLGVRLFQRTTRSVSVSEPGARFLEQIRPALGQIAEAVRRAHELRDKPAGTLRFNMSAAAARRLFAPLVLPFLERYPDVSVDIVSEGRLVDIVAGGFDAGVRLAGSVPRDMVAVPCGPPMRFVVVGAPTYFAAHARPKSPADLHQHQCICRRMPSGVTLAWEFEKGTDSLTIDVRGPLTLDADELMVQAALAGVGLAWVNEWSVEALLASGQLVSVLDDWSQPFAGICLYYPSHRHVSAALRAFVALIRELELAGTSRRGRPRKAASTRERTTARK